MAKKYACYGGLTWFKHLFSDKDCLYYQRDRLLSLRIKCQNAGNPKPFNVPKESCELYKKADDCFIASEIYGPDAEETNLLRAWRDESLDTTPFGRMAVRTYYVISPKIAGLLKRYPGLKRAVKSRLDNFVEYLKR